MLCLSMSRLCEFEDYFWAIFRLLLSHRFGSGLMAGQLCHDLTTALFLTSHHHRLPGGDKLHTLHPWQHNSQLQQPALGDWVGGHLGGCLPPSQGSVHGASVCPAGLLYGQILLLSVLMCATRLYLLAGVCVIVANFVLWVLVLQTCQWLSQSLSSGPVSVADLFALSAQCLCLHAQITYDKVQVCVGLGAVNASFLSHCLYRPSKKLNYGKDIQRKCWNNWFFQLRLLAFTTNILEIHIHICRHSPLKTYKLTQTDDADLLVQTFYFRDFLIWKVPFVFRPLGMMAAAGLAGRSPWLATTCTIGPGALAVSHQALVHHRWQHRWACCSVLHSLMTPSGLCLWWTYPARPLAALLTFALTLCLWWTQHARPRAAPLMKLINLCPRVWCS